MSFREQKERARLALHKAMEVEAFCTPVRLGFPKPVKVRVHTEFKALGDVKGTSFVYAERRDESPRVIFLASEHEPERGDVVMISSKEGYVVESSDPVYNVTITSFVRPLLPAERHLYAAPPAFPVYSAGAGLLPISTIETVVGLGVSGDIMGLLPEATGELA